MLASRLRMALIAGWICRCRSPRTALAQAEKPQYGGTLEIGTVYVDAVGAVLGSGRLELEAQPRHRACSTSSCSPPISPSRVRNGGKHPFYADAWLPSDAMRGELAESWEWKENPLRVEIKLRKGIMFPEKPGVMASRELTAEDVVFSYNRLDKSPKKIVGYFDHVDKVEATDTHTVVFTFK